MATYLATKQRVASELNGTLAATDTAIASAILTAIAKYEPETFRFNDASTTVATVAGTSSYNMYTGATAITWSRLDPPTVQNSTTIWTLAPVDYDWMVQQDDSVTPYRGRPDCYAVFNNQIRLYPTPDAIYTLTLRGTRRLTALSADGDTNGWTTDGEALIRNAALAELCQNYTQEYDRAQIYLAKAYDEFNKLRVENERIRNNGPVRGYF